MRDTSKVDRTVVVDEFQELSKREMEDVTGGSWDHGKSKEDGVRDIGFRVSPGY